MLGQGHLRSILGRTTSSEQRRLILSLTRQQLHSRYRQSVLAVAWSVIQPLALIGVYALFFRGVLRLDGGDLPYLSFIVSGLVAWRFFSSCVSTLSSISDSLHLISKAYFPREVIPLVHVLVNLIDLGVGLVIMVVIAASQSLYPSITLVALPLVLVPLVLFTAAATILASSVAVFVRDLRHGMPLLLQAMFFATPIMYAPFRVPDGLRWLLNANPIAVVIAGIRDTVLRGVWPTWYILAFHIALAAGCYLVAVSYVRSVEHRMVDLL